MAHASPAEMLLAGPRGRRLCWLCADEQSFRRTGRYQLRGVEYDAAAEVVLTSLERVLVDTDLSEFSAWTDEVTLLEVVADSVDRARYWQDPDELDRALEDRQVIEALQSVAEAIGQAHASAWWTTGVTLDGQVRVEWPDGGALPSRLTGAATVLEAWKKRVAEDEERLRDEHVSAAWWSPPIWWPTPEEAKGSDQDRPALGRTTRSLSRLGAVGLLLVEDGFGTPDALCRPVRCHGRANVFEVRDGEDWLDLTGRYPIEVTSGRRGNWRDATGLNGRWMLPDWELVAQDYDAVHLSVMGYLATSGRALRLDANTATLIAGWNADETWWLTDALTVTGDPRKWEAAELNPPRAWRPVNKNEH